MKFGKVLLCALCCAALAAMGAACAETAVPGDEALIAYGAEWTLREDAKPRACYAISLTDAASEMAAEVYGGYARVLLVEYGFVRVPPIVESQFVCIGATESGEIETLPPPATLIARSYDLSVCDGLKIELLPE